jgi:hypothetical protein
VTVASSTRPRTAPTIMVLLFMLAHLAWMAAPSNPMLMDGEDLNDGRAGTTDPLLAAEPMTCPGGLGGCSPLWTPPAPLPTSGTHAELATLLIGSLVLKAADLRRMLAHGPGPPRSASLQVLLQVFRP